MNDVRAIDIRLLGKKRTGDEAVFFNLTKEILASDKKHQYLLLTDEQDQQKLAVIQGRLGCIGQGNVRFVPLAGKNRFIWNLVTLPWFLIRNQVDTYHTQYILPFFVPSRTKILLHIHDVSFRVYPELIGWKDRLFLSLLIPRSLRRADLVLTPSQFTKDEIVRHYGAAASKIAVIPNAVSSEFLTEAQSDVMALRKKYHLPERFILYVGTLQPRKNIPFLIESFGILKKRVPNVSLVLIGNRSGHHFDPAVDHAVSVLGLEKDVFFPGYVDQQDLPGVMQMADVFAFPSLYEGFGIPILEAMSQKVPVAASDIPCLREVALDAASYFDPASVASCEENLYTLLTDDRRREDAISRGMSRFSLFSWRRSAEILLSLYEKQEFTS